MKRLLIALMLLLALPLCGARAEETYFHNALDLLETCYHATPLCVDAGGAKDPISRDLAVARGLYPCPVCVGDGTPMRDVQAVARGGTIVLRMTDAWMASRPDIGTVFALSGAYVYEGDDAPRGIAQWLHGDAYARFVEAVEKTGQAEATAFYPALYPKNGEQTLCRRHVGEAWYAVLRPNAAARKKLAKQGKLDVDLRFFGGATRYENGVLTQNNNLEWTQESYPLKPDSLSASPVFTQRFDGFTLSLFREMDANIFVLKEPGLDPALLEDGATLTLEGRDTGIALFGYMDGGTCVYVGVLDDVETAAVVNGGQLFLTHPAPTLPDEFTAPTALAAQAGDLRYTTGSDPCFHATPLCLSAGGASQRLTEAEARGRGLLPCPVCVEESLSGSGVRAVARGGTVVLRVTDEWMGGRQDIGDSFGWSWDACEGVEAMELLARRLHGDAYVDFLNGVETSGQAEAEAYYPNVFPENGEAQLCLRHIGGAWYLVFRPDAAARGAMAKQGQLDIHLRFFGGPLSYEDGKLIREDTREWSREAFPLKPEKLGAKAVFSGGDGSLSVSLFREMDADIFVLREKGADPSRLREVPLTLNGEDTGIRLDGYMDGTDGVYVGVFTAPEAAAVKAGAALTLAHDLFD